MMLRSYILSLLLLIVWSASGQRISPMGGVTDKSYALGVLSGKQVAVPVGFDLSTKWDSLGSLATLNKFLYYHNGTQPKRLATTDYVDSALYGVTGGSVTSAQLRDTADTIRNYVDMTFVRYEEEGVIFATPDYVDSNTAEMFAITGFLVDSIALKLNSTDTAGLSARINTKLNAADTAGLSSRINAKLNASDTAGLSARINLKMSASDTAGLSARINLKLNAADTAGLSARINGKLSSGDTAGLSNRINLKLTATDTASMSNRINLKMNASDTASLSNRINLKLGSGDTVALSNRIDLKLNSSDTAALSNRVNLKLNASDTAGLSNRISLKLNASDTVSLSNRVDLKMSASDTVSLSNRVNLKLNSSDTAGLSNRINVRQLYSDTSSFDATQAWVYGLGYTSNVGTIAAITGDVTASGTGTVTATLTTVNATPATYGGAAAIPIVTVDSKGRATTITTVAVAAAAASITGTVSVAKGGTGRGTLTTGNLIIGNGTTAVTLLAPSTAGKMPVSDGSTFVMSTPTFPNASATSGKVIKSDGTNWVASTETYAAPGASGNRMVSDGTNWSSLPPVQGVTAATVSTTYTIASADIRPIGITITAQNSAILFAAPTGTFADMQLLLIAIRDNGTARALTWNSAFVAGTSSGIDALPTTTTINKWIYIQYLYNLTAGKWFLQGITNGFP